MTLDDLIQLAPITRIAVALGADQPDRSGRTRAWYRDGNNNQTVKLNNKKQCWHDHRDHGGGGVLDLIQKVLGCGRGNAVHWLADLNGVQLDNQPLSEADRRNYALKKARAQQLKREIEDFRRGLLVLLEWYQRKVAAVTTALLELDEDPGDELLNTNRAILILDGASLNELRTVISRPPPVSAPDSAMVGGANASTSNGRRVLLSICSPMSLPG